MIDFANIGTTAVAIAAATYYLKKAMDSYMEGYGKKRGELRALNEKFDEVLRQTAQTTETVKAIEARFSGSLWNEQERWRLRRDTYISLLEHWARVLHALDDYAFRSTPNRGAYFKTVEELERRPDYLRSNVLKTAVFSAPVLEAIEKVESELSALSTNDAVWNPRTKEPTALGQAIALRRMGLLHHVQSLATIAGQDLAAFGADATTAFQRQLAERQRFSELFHLAMEGTDLSPEDAAWLHARLPERAGATPDHDDDDLDNGRGE